MIQVEDDFDDLFRDCQEIRDAVRRELLASGDGQRESFDEEDEEIIVEEYFSDGEEGNVKLKC